jgi:hypothetical protein
MTFRTIAAPSARLAYDPAPGSRTTDEMSLLLPSSPARRCREKNHLAWECGALKAAAD